MYSLISSGKGIFWSETQGSETQIFQPINRPQHGSNGTHLWMATPWKMNGWNLLQITHEKKGT